jgi:hypothetical protein
VALHCPRSARRYDSPQVRRWAHQRVHGSPVTSACSNKSRSPMPWTLPTSPGWRWASPPTPSTSTRSRGRHRRPPRPQRRKAQDLDGVERTLDPEDLIVADHAKPLGLAGVMGGWDTMITPETTQCPRRSRLVRSRRRPPHRPPPRPAYGRFAPLRARRGFQRCPTRLGHRQQHHSRKRRVHRG